MPRPNMAAAISARDCGTGLFYTNEIVFPAMTDVQSATLDDPGALPPQVHIQTADRIAWMKDIDALPAVRALSRAAEPHERRPRFIADPNGLSRRR